MTLLCCRQALVQLRAADDVQIAMNRDDHAVTTTLGGEPGFFHAAPLEIGPSV